MTDLQFLPWEKPATCQGHDVWSSYRDVPILKEFMPFAAAFSNWEGCDVCDKDWFDLEVCISPACSLEGVSFLDWLHEAEEISRVRLSRGMEPWCAEVHFGGYHFESRLWLPWLQFHFFGPFEWGEDTARLSRLANTVIPYLCENSLEVAEYAWPLRQPHGGS
jgi:hypothetical protein